MRHRDLPENPTVPCRICGRPTDFLGTRLCNPCWEGRRGVETIAERTTGETQRLARKLRDMLDRKARR